ncbi:hypothetical protein [Enterovibrio norvegicus]|uniref:hypothetical protein n=1 Tax=Enterovibrio norvegicus TaxID=188144 RepID=UPI000C853407|nr:hypothetical protein [Enterovibrio norvegicus]PMH64449.1 hypothetical protein BCU62_15455 [Enterovibrio norvegicus]
MLFLTQSEAYAAIGYLGCYVADSTNYVFIPRWRKECHTIRHIGWQSVLSANDAQSLRIELAENFKQRIEFLFEDFIINFEPEKIRYFAYEALPAIKDNLELHFHTPKKISLVLKNSSDSILLASYNISESEAIELSKHSLD